GWQIMAGGSDGLNVLESTHVPTPTVPLMAERLAEAAAWNVVQDDANILEELNGDRTGTLMFSHVVFREADDTEDAIRDEIVSLWWQVLGEEIAADGAEADSLFELYGQLFELLGSEREAWVSVLAAILREPELMFY
ncbi:MAG: hypothetical protein GY884_09295, partial [Proteobacteria bacterium]|nr:hypothetical protein [Pseudomonadota bacterium]